MKKNNKIKKIIILILIILFLLIIFSTIFSIYYSMNNNIVEGIEIQGISVSGITKENAENKLKEIINNLEKKEIIIHYNNYENKINLNELEINYNINDAINNACEIGRKNNIFINNFEILKTIIENLVENKEEVKITRIDDEKGILLKVKVAQDDMGKVIGKQGKVARAIRTIMKSVTSNEQKNVGVIFEEE